MGSKRREKEGIYLLGKVCSSCNYDKWQFCTGIGGDEDPRKLRRCRAIIERHIEEFADVGRMVA